MPTDDAVVALAEKVRAGHVKAVEVAQATLADIDRRNGALNAFLAVPHESVLEQARAIDEKRARGESLGALAGVPIGIKDALCTRGLATTAGSKILEGYIPPYDATVVARLRAADAIIVGKTNMDEFAMGSSNENSAYGAVKNPWDPERAPGGSSGGSAAAVAARLVSATLGSDTGGSIRQPAALSGTFGVKPTYGRVSRFGLIAFASSLDQVGPFATDVRGAARVLTTISGKDPKDATSLGAPVEDFEAACGASIKGLRIGVPDEYFAKGLDPEVEASIRAAISELEAEGCVVKPIKLAHTRYAVATYYVIADAEASSNLARFDGVRYGLRVEPPRADVRAMYGATRDAGFGAEVKRRILLGTFVLSAGYYDAYYVKAQKVRTLIRRDFEEAFREVDVICSPTSPTPAFRLGEKVDDPLAMYLNDVYTLPASLAGLPGCSVPAAPTQAGLPVGLQIVAPWLRETTLFSVAAAFEARSPAPRFAVEG
ncbi:Asp-tRNA(Asn)/Glu-tRNA(Gln) amidotransferase subunit GatA [Pendulispora albinea]|uniref:Glutamyl-tRNA(Gln) amidotransferase subunit A n=1 Tax=Pendulispora albinea TaxID=2741071 RepID=A0ABZ2LQY2_9BACT